MVCSKNKENHQKKLLHRVNRNNRIWESSESALNICLASIEDTTELLETQLHF
ncbi:hypothetical protein YC2023_040792 [Brassica napus]